jgi:hypothetical protein
MTKVSPMPRQNSITRPSGGTVTSRVWDIADGLRSELGDVPARGAVIAKGQAEGINRETLSTQYGRWQKFHGLPGRSLAASPPSPTKPAKKSVQIKLANQVVGNVGLYYVCYRLSLAGWNVMPTARNARGVDIVLYSTTGKRFASVQVKALSSAVPVPLGSHLDNLFADHFVICRRIASERPECFVLSPEDVRERAYKSIKKNFWLRPRYYEEFRDRWDRIGSGSEDGGLE